MIHPETDPEYLYSIIVMILGKFCVAYIVGNVISIMSDIGILKFEFYTTSNQIDGFLVDQNAPESLRKRFDYYELVAVN